MSQAVELRQRATAAPPAGPTRGVLPGQGALRTLAWELAPAGLAVAACVLAWAAGWRGTDWAAQVYRAGQVAHGGLSLWDPGWYGGTFPLNYSLLVPLAGGYLGLWPVAGLSAAGAAFFFDRLVTVELGRRPLGVWYFALTTFVPVAIGQLPTIAGEALALSCLLCLRPPSSGPVRPARLAGGLLLGAFTGLASPVAGAFLALALVAWGVSAARTASRRTIAFRIGAGALVLAVSAALPLAFPEPGWFPFSFSEAAAVVVIAALLASPLLGAPASLRTGAALYALVTVALWAVRTPMGDNDARLAAYVVVPLALTFLPEFARRARRALPAGGRALAIVLAGAIAAALVVWDWSPVTEAFGGATNGASSVAAYYKPLESELTRLAGGRAVRVEVPPLAHHWESAYLAPEFPLARGWERQLDIAYAPLFYRPGPVQPGAYRSWLLSNGVSYVALANAPLDYAAVGEAALLRSGEVSGLVPVWRNKDWELWKVTGSAGLAGWPAQVDALRRSQVALHFSTPGSSIVKVRWTPYWSLPAEQAPTACIERAPGGWTEVSSRAPGLVELRLSFLGADHGSCKHGLGPAAP